MTIECTSLQNRLVQRRTHQNEKKGEEQKKRGGLYYPHTTDWVGVGVTSLDEKGRDEMVPAGTSSYLA
ncbi:hypothetical protein VTN00DRAFT_2124 [Thermoascus crustaceus]|uniref:uncharacterized protein n=1 Tax=Thermoascus crustaceus TaxID=5088 RepID=UPI003743F314